MPETRFVAMRFYVPFRYICFMKPTLSDYLIRLNPQQLYTIAVNATLPLVVIGSFLSVFYGTMGFLISIIVIPTGLIALFYTISKESKIILFTADAIVVERKTGRAAISYSYPELDKISLINRVKQRGYIELELGGKIYRGDLDRKDGLDASFKDFIFQLFEKNPELECFGDFSLERYKYFMLNGEVREVLL